jgi:putative AlgH/UPF0301 family transcriptional regulator
MQVNGKTEVTIWGKKIPAIAAEISVVLGGPIQSGTTLLLSNEEEKALDSMFGMAWPLVISQAVCSACSKPEKAGSSRCNIEFPDEHHVAAAYV